MLSYEGKWSIDCEQTQLSNRYELDSEPAMDLKLTI